MKSPVDELEAAVLSLSQHDRARLAERLIASLDEPSEVEAAWVEEIARRIAAFRAGDMKSYPGPDVMSEARSRIGP